MITINGITKTFDSVKALDAVSTKVGDGSIFGLIGSNGSGKSTLLRLLAGIYRPDSGTIRYGGEDVYENYQLKQNIVYLSDEQYFLPHATLSDMRAFYRSVYDRFDDERYMRMTEMFGLDRDRKINTFSKGMQKQSSLLLGLSVRPRWLLCDETFDGIDPVMRGLVRRIIADDVADGAMTAIVSTHNLRELEDLTDHICLLHRGSVILDRELDDVKETLHKVQIVFEEDNTVIPESLDVVSGTSHGRLRTFTCRGNENEITDLLGALKPVYCEVIPLTLEEIFITEMEALGYDTKSIIE